MNRLKKFIMNLLDIIELHIPVILFSAVFIMYVIMIVYRYVLNKTVFQMAELCQVLYLASAMLGASYSGRTDNHVIFPLVYDKLNALGQKIFRIISDFLVFALCAAMWVPSLKSTIWMARKKTEVLDISFAWIYSVFMIFMTLSGIYYLVNFIRELRTPVGEKHTSRDITPEDEERPE